MYVHMQEHWKRKERVNQQQKSIARGTRDQTTRLFLSQLKLQILYRQPTHSEQRQDINIFFLPQAPDLYIPFQAHSYQLRNLVEHCFHHNHRRLVSSVKHSFLDIFVPFAQHKAIVIKHVMREFIDSWEKNTRLCDNTLLCNYNLHCS